MRKKKRNSASPWHLPWEYCECGCKGYGARVGPLFYAMYPHRRGHLLVLKSHGSLSTHVEDNLVGSYSSFTKTDQAAHKHAIAELKKQQTLIRKRQLLIKRALRMLS